MSEHGDVRGPLDLSPWDYNRLNSYNPMENSQPNTQTLWEIYASKHLKVSKMGDLGRREGKEIEIDVEDTAQSSLWDLSRGEESGSGLYSEHFCWSD